MLAEIVHLHLGDEEASRERFVYEQQEAFDAAAQREHQRTELEEIAGSLRADSPCKQSNTSTTSYNKNKPASPPT